MRLDDSVIAHIAKLLQLSIISGTDIVDHIRMIRLQLEENTNMLLLTKDYENNSESNIQKMIDEINTLES